MVALYLPNTLPVLAVLVKVRNKLYPAKIPPISNTVKLKTPKICCKLSSPLPKIGNPPNNVFKILTLTS